MSYPHYSCSFAVINKCPNVSHVFLDSISPNYPKVMTTSAFGALIPNMEDDYCLDLLNAFYIHQYEYSVTIAADKTKVKTPAAEETN